MIFAAVLVAATAAALLVHRREVRNAARHRPVSPPETTLVLAAGGTLPGRSPPRQDDGDATDHASLAGVVQRHVQGRANGCVQRSDRWTAVAAWCAALLGCGHAAFTAYWALGGSALLHTIGGEVERWGRQRSGPVVVALWLIAIAKVVIGIVPLAVRRLGDGPRSIDPTVVRRARLFGWAAGLGLSVYGGVLTVAGLLVEIGVIDAAPDADRVALSWHTYLWDPWFAVWGTAITVVMWRTRSAIAR